MGDLFGIREYARVSVEQMNFSHPSIPNFCLIIAIAGVRRGHLCTHIDRHMGRI